MTIAEFFLKISTQYQMDKWWKQRKISIKKLVIDLISNSQITIVGLFGRQWGELLNKIKNEILRLKGLTWP